MKDKLRAIRKTLQAAWAIDRVLVLLLIEDALVSALQPYVSVLLTAYLLDGFANGTEPRTMLFVSLACFGGLFVVDALQRYLASLRNVRMTVAGWAFDVLHTKRTLEMDYELLESPDVNRLRGRMNSDRNWGAGFLSVYWQLPYLLNRIFSLAAAFIILFPLFFTGNFFASIYTPVFFAAAAGISLASGFLTGRFSAKEYALMDEISDDTVQQHYGHFSFLYWGGGLNYKQGKDARIFNMIPLVKKYIEADDVWNIDWERRFTRNGGARGLVSGLSSGLIWTGSFLIVALRALAGAITVGAVLKYATALNNFARGLAELTDAFEHFAQTAKRQQSFLAYMEYPDVLHKGTLPIEKRRDNEYEIEFHNVSFCYPGSETYALRNFSLRLQIGRRLAVVGMNGSGKTTMIKLLCRLYEPTEGKITLNNIDIKKYDYKEYLQIFSVVFQDFRLFSLPLGENVACTTQIDEEKAASSLAKAGFGGRLAQMPHGLKTFLYKDFDQGVEISGGEAQKIALARALYKNAPYVVLDEPTAALDPMAEFEIYSKFDEIIDGRTAIYISHRLSSCRFCDDIAVFHEGQLVQRGSHDSLIADKAGKYFALWNAQAQHYTEELA